jgi:hypothetical protein
MSRRPRPEGPEGTLYCSRGKHFVSIKNFSLKKRLPNHKRQYYHGWCKTCMAAYMKEGYRRA